MGQWPERLIDQCQPRHCLPQRRCVRVGRDAEGFVPGERSFLDPDGVGRGLLRDRGERDRPARNCGASAAPVVDLACGDAGEPGEGALADVGAGEPGGKRGVQERSHGALGMELTSIARPETPVGRRSRRDNIGYRAEWNFLRRAGAGSCGRCAILARAVA